MKKYLLLLLLFTTSIFASDTDTFFINVTNSAAVEYMFTLFNFIAALFQSESYLSILKIMVLFGGTMVFVQAVIQATRGESTSKGLQNVGIYMLVMTALLTIVFSHKSTVQVRTDNLDSVYYTDINSSSESTTLVTIDNVPTMFAYATSFVSEFGKKFETLFKTGLSVDNSFNTSSYASDQRGAMKLLALDLKELDSTGATITGVWLNDCILAPASKDPDTTIVEDLLKSNNLTSFIDTNLDTEVAGVKVRDYVLKYKEDIYKCDDMWNTIKNDIVPTFKTNLGSVLGGVGGGAVQLLTGQANVPKSDFDEMAINAGLINTLMESPNALANGVDIQYSVGKSRADFIQGSMAQGAYMAEMLPYMQQMFRILLYGLFPFIFAVSLMPGGISILKNYAKALLWVEMWGPVAAILNYTILVYGEHKISGEINAYQAGQMFSDTAALAGMAGYLYALVPAISWGLMSGSFTMLQGLAGGVAAKLDANLGTNALAKDTGKMTAQKELQKKRGEMVSLAEMETMTQNHAGWDQAATLDAKMDLGSEKVMNEKEFSIKNPAESLDKKLEQINSKKVDSVVDIESKMNAADFNKKAGELSQVKDISKYKNVGKKQGTNVNAVNTNVEKHGINKIQDNAVKTMSEDISAKATRFGEIEKSGHNVDSFAEQKAKVDFQTKENPAVNAPDLNGDGKVSDKEIAKAAKISDNQAKLDLYAKDRTQKELKNAAKDYQHSGSRTIQKALKESKGEVGGDIAKMAQSVAAKTAASTKTDTFNARKDTQNVENLQSQNVAPEKLADVESKDAIGKVSYAKSETQTLSSNLQGVIGQYDDVKQNAIKALEEKGVNPFTAERQVNKQLVANLADKGIAVPELTKQALDSDIQAVNNEEYQAINKEIVSHFDGAKLGKMNTYNHLRNNLLPAAKKSGNEVQVKALEKQISKMEKDLGGNPQEQIEQILNSDKVKNIKADFTQKREKVINDYEKSGLINTDKNGEIKFLDTQKMLQGDNLSDKQRMFTVSKIKKGLDGLKAETVDLKGMERKWVSDISGGNATDISKAEVSWVKTGNFSNDITYHAVQNGYVNKETMATVNTGIRAIKEGMSFAAMGRGIKGVIH